MLSIKYSLRRKLILVWLLSILIVTAVVGTSYFYLYTARHEAQALARVGNAFLILNNLIEDRTREVQEKMDALASQQGIISSIHLLDTYQDIENYQPTVFNPEKEKLALELAAVGKIANFNLIVAHDSKLNLASYYVNYGDGKPHVGYQSFREGNPVFMEAGGDGSAFLKVESLPPFVSFHDAHDKPEMKIRGHKQGLVMEASVNVMGPRSGGAHRTIGSIHAFYILNELFANEVSDKTGLNFALIGGKDSFFGKPELVSLAGDLTNDLPILNRFGIALPVFEKKDIGGKVVGIMRLPLAKEKNAYFVFEDSRTPTAGIGDFETAIFIMSALVMLVMFPTAIVFLNRIVSRPVENLMMGVEGLRSGKFSAIPVSNNHDELSRLASLFNAMAGTIDDREKALKDSEERFRALANHTPNKLHIKDLQGRFLLANPKTLELMGASREEDVIGKTSEALFPLEQAKAFIDHDRAVIETGQPVEIEELFKSGDSTHVFLTVRFPILDANGDIVAVGGSGFEITDRKLVEAELIEHRIHLEQMVAVRTAEVEEKATQLEESLKAEKSFSVLQQQFVSLVSHEFRTPLSIIDGSAQRIIRTKDKITPDQLVERSSKIRFAVERMVGLIDTTLYASRLDAGKIEMHIQPCEIRSLIAEICHRLSEVSPNHDIRTDLDAISERIDADPKLMEHIFTNLLSNAVKYAPDAPLIKVSGQIDGEMAVVAIKDQGLGIPEDDLPHIFERYFRARTAQGIQGTGLGLRVCKEFIEMHGGRIEVTSKEGEGSTFIVRLPLSHQDHKNSGSGI